MISFPTIPRYLKEIILQKKMKADPSTPRGHVREKILAWETRIKNYKEAEARECMDGDKDSKKGDRHDKNPIKFAEGDLVLLRHSEIQVPPDDPSP